MRLLNVHTLQLETFASKTPDYAILSHTWGDGEVLFTDVEAKQAIIHASASERNVPHVSWRGKGAATKVLKSADIAKKVYGLDYIWIDTCCIDKSSSAELSEAINTMFKWYGQSDICIAYINDYAGNPARGVNIELNSCKWFTRGWTLQELIAPEQVDFYDSDWNHVGSRSSLVDQLSRITSVDPAILRRGGGRYPHLYPTLSTLLNGCSVGQRLSWVSRRETTREEDIAYCLLGLFGINMPLLYGEGMGAFRRLQEEIAQKFPRDQSLLAWTSRPGIVSDDPSLAWFAHHPRFFAQCGRIECHRFNSTDAYLARTQRGLEMQAQVIPATLKFRWANGRGAQACAVALLNCSDERDDFQCVGIPLFRNMDASMTFTSHSRATRIDIGYVFPMTVTWSPETGPSVDVTKSVRPDLGIGPIRQTLTSIELHGEGQRERVFLESHPRPCSKSRKPQFKLCVDGNTDTYTLVRTQPNPHGSRLLSNLGSCYRPSRSSSNRPLGERTETRNYCGVAALASDHDSFYILWGFGEPWGRDKFTAEKSGERLLWGKPYCRIHRSSVQTDVFLCRAADHSPSETFDWIRYLLEEKFADEGVGEEPKSAPLNDRDEYVAWESWVDGRGQSIRVSATCRMVEYLGRAKYEVSVDVHVGDAGQQDLLHRGCGQ